MTWTSEMPIADGYYFVRSAWEPVEIIQLFTASSPRLTFFQVFGDLRSYYVHDAEHEFLGPFAELPT